MRRKRDSNPRYALDVYTLSRRASSTTRAPLLSKTNAKYEKKITRNFLRPQIYDFCFIYASLTNKINSSFRRFYKKTEVRLVKSNIDLIFFVVNNANSSNDIE